MTATQLNILYGTANGWILYNWNKNDFRIHAKNTIDYSLLTYTYIVDIEFGNTTRKNYILLYYTNLKCAYLQWVRD